MAPGDVETNVGTYRCGERGVRHSRVCDIVPKVEEGDRDRIDRHAQVAVVGNHTEPCADGRAGWRARTREKSRTER